MALFNTDAATPWSEEEAKERTKETVKQELEFLCDKDRETLGRTACARLVHHDKNLANGVHRAIKAYRAASESCVTTSAMDPNWFTLNVQDSHKHRILHLQSLLESLESEPIREPPGVSNVDKLKGAVFMNYSKTASITTGWLKSEQVSGLQAGFMSGLRRAGAAMSQASSSSAAAAQSSGYPSNEAVLADPWLNPPPPSQSSSNTPLFAGCSRSGLDTSDPMLAKSWARVCDETDPAAWVVFTYAKEASLACAASGVGGRTELLSWLKDDVVTWAGFRTRAGKLYRVCYIGARVEGTARTLAAEHTSAGLQVFVGDVADVAQADSQEELEGCFDLIDF